MKLDSNDLIVFKDKAEDIIGAELDSFVTFLVDKVY